MLKKSADHKWLIICWALAAALVSLVLILIRILPIGGPAIFSDEYAYAAWSSAFYHGAVTPPPLAASFGNWLYLRLYEIVFVGVGSFLVKARVLNTVFSALGAGILVLTLHIADRSRKPLLAASLSVGFAAALLGTYAAYFIPEAPYFAVVCLWLFVLTTYTATPSVRLALGVGVVGGLATMTKAHGILMLPATLVLFLILGVRQARGWRAICVDCALLVAGWLLCTIAIDAFLGNGGSLNPLGSFYSGLGVQTAEHLGGYSKPAILLLAARHLATLVLIMGLPLLICFSLGLVALFRPLRKGYPAALQYPALALVCMLIGMLLVTVVFTVSVAGHGPAELLTRLHGRYYEHFALLAACFGIVGSAKVLVRWIWPVRLTVLVLFLAALVAAELFSRSIGWQNPNDFALAYGLYALPAGRIYAVVLGMFGAAIAMIWPKHAPFALTCTFLIWLGIDLFATEKLRWSVQEQAAGQVAAMVAEAESGSTSATVEIVGPSGTIPVLRAGFHVLNHEIQFALGANANQCGVGGGRPDWVITVDNARDPCGYSDGIRIGQAAAAPRKEPSAATSAPSAVARNYKAKLALSGPPTVTTDGKGILVKVRITNIGASPFGTITGPHNIKLGAHSINAAGDIVDNDLARGRLPQIEPGAVAQASILLPIGRTLGYRVELLPVQEGVGWFDKWGTKSLVVGPFEACSGREVAKVCDASGQPLLVAQAAR